MSASILLKHWNCFALFMLVAALRTELHVLMQLDPITTRFAHPECRETRTWEEISSNYINARHMFETGSLGDSANNLFQVYACFWGHACLQKVTNTPYSDAMCYMYHEEENTWHPWALQSEIQQCTKTKIF
jgi:hypothetical protein